MDACPTTTELQALAEDPSAPPNGLADHLERCARCRDALAAARADHALFTELRAAARPASDRPEPGSIPGYELMEELHRGGQGVVYRATQLSTGRSVAVKVLAPERTSYKDRLRLEREIDLACRLRHPGIPAIFDRGVTADRPFYVMELVAGQTLDVALEREQLTLGQKLALFLRLCAIVDHAHRRGVIHRDLKPSNVLVDDEGAPHVLDFGVAHALQAAELRVTQAGEFSGTLAYASPEQVGGDPDAADTRSDVYSLGVVLYEMLTGRLPYDAHGAVSEVIGRILHAPPADAALPGVDGDLSRLLATALAKDPAQRYASVEALARDVAHWLAREPLEAGARGAWYELQKGFARHRAAVLASAAVLLAAVVLGAGFVRERLEARRQREQAELVRSVFQDVLAAAAPQRMGGDVRLLEMYEQASARIETELSGAPDAQAALHLTIADTYQSLLMNAEAEPHARKAVERYRALGAKSELDLARALDLLGGVLASQNRPEAVAVREAALAIRRRRLGDGAALVAQSRRGLAEALLMQWELDDAGTQRARGLLEQALAVLQRVHGNDHPEVADTLYWLAATEAADDERARLLERALAILERHAPQDPRTIRCLNGHAAWLQASGRFEEAATSLRRSVALTTELYGDERSAEMLWRQAELELARGASQNAEELIRQSLARELELQGRRHPEQADALSALAARLGDEGAPPYAEALRTLRGHLGDGAFELATHANHLAQVLIRLGRAAECEPILREALNIRCRAFGRDCPVRQETIELVAQVLIPMGRGAEASAWLEESLATFQRRGRADSPRALRTRELLACCTEDGG